MIEFKSKGEKRENVLFSILNGWRLRPAAGQEDDRIKEEQNV